MGFTTYFRRFKLARPALAGIYSMVYSLVAFDYFSTYHYSVSRIIGPSMAPLLSPDYLSTGARDLVLFKRNIRLADQFPDEGGKGQARSELKRGMIVSFLSPTSGKMAVKRIVALEGDLVRPLGRHNTRSGGQQANQTVDELEEEVAIPFGHVWVEGDQVDREKNLDSTSYGPVSKSLIRGVGVRIVYPRARMGKLDWEKGWDETCGGRVTIARANKGLPEEWALH